MSVLQTRLLEYLGLYAPLPPLQNGFRPKHRTADNLFILRTLHEKAVQEGQPLILAQIDIRKAFDSVNRNTLFQKLYSKGIHGPLIEVLRQSFLNQEVTLKVNNRYSNMITSDTGVSQGDPLSPLLFIIYVADFQLEDNDDPILMGHKIPFLGLADDFSLLSTTPAGSQRKLASLAAQAEPLNLFIHPNKCGIFTMGAWTLIPVLRPITLAGLVVPRLTQITINGFPISSTRLAKGWDSDQYAVNQNRKAAYYFRSIYALKNTKGVVTPNHFRVLYRTIVESQFSYAIETRFDTSAKVSYQLDLTQRYHLRSMAGLHPRAITCILFRDFGLLPLSIRSILLTIRYLQYALETPPTRPVHWAIQTQLTTRSGWYYKLTRQLTPYGLDLPNIVTRPDLTRIVEEAIWEKQHRTLLANIQLWPRLSVWKDYGVSGIISYPRPQKPAAYLQLPHHLARACSRLRTSSHNLAIQRLRSHRRERPREERTCPDCPNEIETEAHALLDCPTHRTARATLTHLPSPIHTLLNTPNEDTALALYQIWRKVDTRYSN